VETTVCRNEDHMRRVSRPPAGYRERNFPTGTARDELDGRRETASNFFILGKLDKRSRIATRQLRRRPRRSSRVGYATWPRLSMHRTNGILLRYVTGTRPPHGRQTRKMVVARGQTKSSVQEQYRQRVERIWVHRHDIWAQYRVRAGRQARCTCRICIYWDAALRPSRKFASRAGKRRLAHAPTNPRTVPRCSKQWECRQSALEFHRQSHGADGSQDSLSQQIVCYCTAQFSAETQKGSRLRRRRRVSSFACQDFEPWCENAGHGASKEGRVAVGIAFR